MFVLTTMMSSTVLVSVKAKAISHFIRHPRDLVEVCYINEAGEAAEFTYDGKRQHLVIGMSFA
jgi:hypothetical protein